MKNKKSKRGFTLLEVMIVMTILGMLITGVMAFYIQSVKSMYASDQRMKLAGQINRFSNELILQASRSNQFILYKSAAAADFASAANRQGIQSMNGSTPISPLFPAGDFVVFVYYEINTKLSTQQLYRILKLEGYFLTTTSPGGTGAVHLLFRSDE